MKVDEKIKGFLLSFPYEVLHEHDNKNNNIEHFFVGIDKADIKSSIVKKYIETYREKFPIQNLSKASMKYFAENDSNYYILIDSLDKNDVFYKQKAKCVENNAANILAIKWIGEPIDMSAHLIYNAEKYVTDFKDVLKDKYLKGKALIDEKKPLIESGIKRMSEKSQSFIDEKKPLVENKIKKIFKK